MNNRPALNLDKRKRPCAIALGRFCCFQFRLSKSLRRDGFCKWESLQDGFSTSPRNIQPGRLSGCEIVKQSLRQDLGSGRQDGAIGEFGLGQIRSCFGKVSSNQRSLMSRERHRILTQVAFLIVQLADGVIQRDALLGDIIQPGGNGCGCRADL